MKIGVFANEQAGGGGRTAEMLAWLSPALAGHRVVAVSGYGAEGLAGAKVLPVPEGQSFLARLARGACALLLEAPDLVIVAGGDGLAAYFVQAMLSMEAPHPPLLGVGVGTANVGPVISCLPGEGPPPDLSGLVCEPVGAVEALYRGEHIAYGMNDIVLTDTLLGTVDGAMVTLGAAEMLAAGAKAVRPPMPAVAEALAVEKNGRPMAHGMPTPAQIVASPLERDRLFGRAVYGAPCLSPFSAEKAALALLSAPMVSMETGAAGTCAFMAVSHLLFAPGDAVTVSGLLPGVHVIADGNPYAIPGDPLTLRYRPALVTVALTPCRKGR